MGGALVVGGVTSLTKKKQVGTALNAGNKMGHFGCIYTLHGTERNVPMNGVNF